MRFVAGIISVLINLGLGLFCLGLGILGWMHGSDLAFPLLPVAEESAAVTLMAVGTTGVLVSVLALAGSGMRSAGLVVWSLAVSITLISAIFRSSYRFEDMGEFVAHLAVSAVSLLLLLASVWRLQGTNRNGYHTR